MESLARWIPTLTLATLGACTLFTPADVDDREDVLVLEVASERVRCVGEMVGLCLRIRSSGEEEWRTFYGVIEGFEHEAGFRYRIRVARREVPDPPADASAYAYRLLDVLSREPGSGPGGSAGPDSAPSSRQALIEGVRTVPGTPAGAAGLAALSGSSGGVAGGLFTTAGSSGQRLSARLPGRSHPLTGASRAR